MGVTPTEPTHSSALTAPDWQLLERLPLFAGLAQDTLTRLRRRRPGRVVAPWTGPAAWTLAGVLWSAAFALYLLRCGPMLLRPRLG